MPQRRQLLQALALSPFASALASLSHAQEAWPGDKPVRVIVPASAGGSLDTLMRPLAQSMTTATSGRFVVENQGGAAGMLGAATVARATPDGHTLLGGGVHHAIIPVVYAKVPYDSAKDLNPVALLATVPNVVLVKASSPYKSIADLIAAAKAAPAGLNYGTGGLGSLHHLSSEYFRKLTGAPLQAVHYKGSAPAIADLVGGQIDLMFETMPNALGQIRGGALRPLAVTSAQRSDQLPDTPTLAEAGVPGLVVTTWYGMFSPAKLDPAVEKQIKKQIDDALATDALRKVWHDYGARVDGPGAKDFKAFYASELRHWREVSAQIGFKPAQ